MSDDLTRFGPLTNRYTATGRHSGFQIELWHDGLNEHRVIFDRDRAVLESKVHAQLLRWAEKWDRKKAQLEKRSARAQGMEGALEATRDAETSLADCERILSHALAVDNRVDWEGLKDHAPFTHSRAAATGIEYDDESGRPRSVIPIDRPVKPQRDDRAFDPGLTLIDWILSARKRRKLDAAEARFAEALRSWEEENQDIDRREKELAEQLAQLVNEFEGAQCAYLLRQQETNNRVDAMRDRYWREGGANAEPIEEHAELVLSGSRYPDWMQTDFELAYNTETRMLVVDYSLPEKSRIPTLQQVTYVPSRNGYREKHLTQRERDALFDRTCYQIALRTLHELFEADEVVALDSIVFNGWVEDVNRGTGHLDRACIMSVHATRSEFSEIRLIDVDPQACFKRLKGVSAARLSGLTPIQPVLQFNRGDRRFVESREIASEIQAGTNLASMPWEDFEHLVRELFEKEFAAGDAEVRVTQASRDGGVDAIVYDPDPLRGGKIVIQAKRYTSTVDVSAVRDLYGTVMNEGANRGILVTTSDYGADSVAFARNKPLTLLNGSNLLALLEKHGHRARIDLREARAAREQRR